MIVLYFCVRVHVRVRARAHVRVQKLSASYAMQCFQCQTGVDNMRLHMLAVGGQMRRNLNMGPIYCVSITQSKELYLPV